MTSSDELFADLPTSSEVGPAPGDLPGSAVNADPEREREWHEAHMAVAALEEAKLHGLQLEFMVFFLRSIRSGETTKGAIAAAQCEWDF